MTPGIYNIDLEQGSSFARTFTISDTALDLSTYDSVRMQIRRTPGRDVIWDSEDTTPGGSIIIEGTDRIRLTLDAATTEAFQFDKAGYDIELVKDAIEGEGATAEVVDKIIKGQILLSKEYTL